jgi:hypothetical protein
MMLQLITSGRYNENMLVSRFGSHVCVFLIIQFLAYMKIASN